jgi:hypothetical protein
MEQAVSLGRELGYKYCGTLVPTSWQSASPLVYVRSTETERTVETAQGVLSGMFPEVHASPSLFFPVFVKAEDESEWGVATFGGWCPRLKAIVKSALDHLSEPSHEHQSFLEELTEHLDFKVPEHLPKYFRLDIYRDHLACRHAHGKELPDGSEKVSGDIVERLNDAGAARAFALFSGAGFAPPDDATRLQAGRMMHILMKNLGAHRDKMHKLLLYSGHDWTIIMLLLCIDPRAFDSRSRRWPKFCSSLVFELWEDTSGDELVRILYDGESLELPALTRAELRDENGKRTFYTLASLQQAMAAYQLHPSDASKFCALPDEPRSEKK